MNNLLEGLQVTLVGMLVVFAGLILIIAIISLMKVFSLKKPAEPEAQPLQAAAPAPVVQAASAAAADDDAALVAAITAAISCLLSQEQPDQPQGFRVRRIRRIA